MIQPRNDRVLIRRIEEPEQVVGSIIVPDVAREKALKGEVLAVGEGRWEEGGWWKVKMIIDINKSFDTAYFWEWIPGHRVPPEVHPGQIVLFNARWNDLASSHYDEDKAVIYDPMLHLIQEADIFGVLNESRPKLSSAS